jgi:hypothetical protein
MSENSRSVKQMPYKLHDSNKLKDCFKKKPWQGNDPTKASFLFVGLDANFDKDIENRLPVIFDYLDDGVKYWQSNDVHHPFRLHNFHGNGRLYHNRFAEIGFSKKHAGLVSFVELLDVPTTGGSNLTASELSPDHLCKLAKWFECGSARYIFLVGSKVATLMRRTKKSHGLDLLPLNQVKKDKDLKILREKNGQTIYEIYHFSVHYQKHVTVLERQIAQIREIVRIFLDGK